VLTTLTIHGEVALERIDYFAVELARRSLETFLASEEGGGFQRVARGAAGSPLVGTLTRLGVPQINLHLVHSEAGAFVSGGSGRVDAGGMKELLDHLPSRPYYPGAKREADRVAPPAREGGGGGRVRGGGTRAADVELPASTVTATSVESLAIVRGASSLLGSGGMLLVHDYGFVERNTPVSWYEALPKSLPGWVTLDFPAGSESGFPRSFFRI